MPPCSPPSHQIHVNARRVLSPELLAKVQAALGGSPAYMWVPSVQAERRRSRTRRVRELASAGLGVVEIASDVNLTPRRVYQIIAEGKAEVA